MSVVRVLPAAILALVIATVVAVTAQAQFGPRLEPKNAAAAEQLRLERRAIDLLNRADRRVRARRASCRPTYPDQKPRTTRDAPDQATLDVLAPLRRAARPEDPLPDSRLFGGFGETYVDYIRRVTAANGQRFSVVIARVKPFPTAPISCLDAARAELIEVLTDEPRAVRRAALRIDKELRQQREEADARNAKGPRDGIFLFTRDKRGGGGGGGGDVADFQRRGNFTSSGGNGPSSTLNGLLPDGVARITLEYPKRVSRGPLYKPTIFPSAYRRTVRVQQNVVSLRVPRDAGDAFPTRMVWRDAAGKIIRIVRQQNN